MLLKIKTKKIRKCLERWTLIYGFFVDYVDSVDFVDGVDCLQIGRAR